ncbi:MAG: hypothetical protein A2X25_14560 [Chloroflexi bacterium GWB2_49_20]|nr:MAG: hypothetical protein A2X25_14560 [Chloroflexi bacterium GWB2_49_20]OGN77265.1 MAG: hypothetical protein A2X26_08685 [Chloroflexi bacterium GWC2_49_37]OGN84738.1 MAG: hypothetical protein A2X27_15420 [Chloroflexi bacterium GWD2_49_16]HBG75099.1 hypothetical protein [Anaerolineae bacterium]HCC78450.1 hypothetical protein [Anaerolineae bacterium]
MGKQQSIFTKQFNPYDLNDVAEVNNSERQRSVHKKTCQEDIKNHDKGRDHRGLLKLEDEEKK